MRTWLIAQIGLAVASGLWMPGALALASPGEEYEDPSSSIYGDPAPDPTLQRAGSSQQHAAGIFARLTGIGIHPTDIRLGMMTTLVEQGKLREAAAIATSDPFFYEVTLRNFSAALGSRSQSPHEDLNIFQSTFMGTVRDELDARRLLYEDYIYVDKDIRELTDGRTSDLVEVLKYQSPQRDRLRDRNATQVSTAGLLTTDGWAWNYEGGTNRRPVVSAFERFLCKPLTAWKLPYLDESAIGRDIDRNPGGDPKVFQKQCRSCHGSIDPMRGAFAGLDAPLGSLRFYPPGRPPYKYERNAQTYPQGHVTLDSSWFNPIAELRPELGIRPELARGHGVRDFGMMLAHSRAFDSCMSQRAFEAVCGRSPSPELTEALAGEFVSSGYNLKALFQSAAIAPSCLEQPRLKDFRGYWFSLVKALQIQRNDFSSTFRDFENRLPAHGRFDEVTPTTISAMTAVASALCQSFSQNHPALSKYDDHALLSDLSLRLFGRELTHEERSELTEGLRASKDRLLFACTALASSLEFLSLE